MGSLENRIAIVTGATGGIGAATVELFLKEGATVLATDLEQEALDALAARLDSGKLHVHAGDASRAEDTKSLMARAAELGGLDVLFLNAGTEGRVAPLVQQERQTFEKVYAINVIGPWMAIKEAVPLLEKRGRGSIIVTSSVAGLRGAPGLAPYVASKHAVLGLIRTAAMELAGMQIRVNGIHPGPVDNRMMSSIEEMANPEDAGAVRDMYTKMVPLGRYATNEECAQMALFLASDASSGSTGASFVVDGGLSAG